MRLEPAKQRKGATNGDHSLADGYFFCFERLGLSRNIQVGSYLVQRIDGSSSMGDLQDRVQFDSMLLGPTPPDGLHAPRGVDEGAIHVEEDSVTAKSDQRFSSLNAKRKNTGPTAT